MTDLVDPAEIESIVGVPRHATRHYAKAVSAEQTVYILHSQDCRNDGRDLRECPWSQALAVHGIDPDQWPEDQPVRVNVRDGRLLSGAFGEPPEPTVSAAMTARPVGAMNEAIANQAVRDYDADPTRIAIALADEVLARGGWKANTCKPLLRAYEIARSMSGVA